MEAISIEEYIQKKGCPQFAGSKITNLHTLYSDFQQDILLITDLQSAHFELVDKVILSGRNA